MHQLAANQNVTLRRSQGGDGDGDGCNDVTKGRWGSGTISPAQSAHHHGRGGGSGLNLKDRDWHKYHRQQQQSPRSYLHRSPLSPHDGPDSLTFEGGGDDAERDGMFPAAVVPSSSSVPPVSTTMRADHSFGAAGQYAASVASPTSSSSFRSPTNRLSSPSSFSSAAERRRNRSRALAAEKAGGAPSPPPSSTPTPTTRVLSSSPHKSPSLSSNGVVAAGPSGKRRPAPLSTRIIDHDDVANDGRPSFDSTAGVSLMTPRTITATSPSSPSPLSSNLPISPTTKSNVTTGQSGALQFIPAYAESSGQRRVGGPIGATGKTLPYFGGGAKESSSLGGGGVGGTSWDQCMDRHAASASSEAPDPIASSSASATSSSARKRVKERAQTVIGVPTGSWMSRHRTKGNKPHHGGGNNGFKKSTTTPTLTDSSSGAVGYATPTKSIVSGAVAAAKDGTADPRDRSPIRSPTPGEDSFRSDFYDFDHSEDGSSSMVSDPFAVDTSIGSSGGGGGIGNMGKKMFGRKSGKADGTINVRHAPLVGTGNASVVSSGDGSRCSPIPSSARSDVGASFSSAGGNPGSGKKGGAGGKVSRLASLFSSRAVVKGSGVTEVGGRSSHTGGGGWTPTPASLSPSSSPPPSATVSKRHKTPTPQQKLTNGSDHQNGHATTRHIRDGEQSFATKPLPTTAIPPSPSRSSTSGASSAYVGWPGTQDRRGRTVLAQPSYDESEEGGASAASYSPSRFGAGGALHHRYRGRDTAAAAASREFKKWINEDPPVGADGEGADSSSSSDEGSAEGTRKLTPLERRFVRGTGPVDLDEDEFDDTSDEECLASTSSDRESEENAADFHLAAAVADAAAASVSPLASIKSPFALSERGEEETTVPSSSSSSSQRSQYPKGDATRLQSPVNSNVRSTAGTPMSQASFPSPSPRCIVPVHSTAFGAESPSGQEEALMSRLPEGTRRGNGHLRGRFGADESKRTRNASGGGGMSDAGSINVQNLFVTKTGPKGKDDGGRFSFQDEAGQRVVVTPQDIRGDQVRQDPWGVDSSSTPSSSLGTSTSQGGPSSGVVTTPLATDKAKGRRGAVSDSLPGIDTSGSEHRVRSAGREVPRRKAEGGTFSKSPSSDIGRTSTPLGPQPPTEATLAANNRMSPSPRLVGATNVRGYRGFIDKTKDVPNLMDEVDSESVTTTSTRATSTFSAGVPVGSGRGGMLSPASSSHREIVQSSYSPSRAKRAGLDTDSDVFDGLSNAGPSTSTVSSPSPQRSGGTSNANRSSEKSVKERRMHLKQQQQQQQLNVVPLGKGLTAIQTTPQDFAVRRTSREFDANLTDTDTDQHAFDTLLTNRMTLSAVDSGDSSSNDAYLVIPKGFTRRASAFESSLPLHAENTDDGSSSSVSKSEHDEGEDVPDLSMYYIQPSQVRKLVRKYRKMCQSSSTTSSQQEAEEDAKKSFALFEMRSRIMETDIERGLERRGGTVPVDDLVLTQYNQASHRIRDAVIVSKAWRDGASPRDVITASQLTRRSERAYFVRRPVRIRQTHLGSPNASFASANSATGLQYTLEEVRWVDDTDFMQLRCPSLGPWHMRGVEMFTIGDCQSILLKLTNERCMQLRRELNEATARQIEAEESMKGDAENESFDLMTKSEISYLAAMEQVKTISKRLVVAEKAFQLVRARIEKLVATYESLLVKIENESCASEISFASSYSEGYDSSHYESDEDDREKETLARRAQRAELAAEVAAREARLAKQEAEKIREEKQRELEELQQKLAELETKSATIASEYEEKLKVERLSTDRGLNSPQRVRDMDASEAKSLLQSAHDDAADDRKVAARERVKAKFRARHAERVRTGPPLYRHPSGESGTSSILTLSSEMEEALGRLVPVGGGKVRNNRLRNTDHDSNRYRLTGEEMFQHLDFYERSLKAVSKKQNPYK